MTLESHSVEKMMLAIHRLLQQELQLLPLHLLARRLWLRCRFGFRIMKKRTTFPPVACAFWPEETWCGSFATVLGLRLWLCLSILLSFRTSTFSFALWVPGLWLGSIFPTLLPFTTCLWLRTRLRLCLRPLGFEDGFGRPLVVSWSCRFCATAAFASCLGFAFVRNEARIDSSFASSRTSTKTALIWFINQSQERQWEFSLESLMQSMWRCNNLHFLTLVYNQVNRVISVGWCDCGMAFKTYSIL